MKVYSEKPLDGAHGDKMVFVVRYDDEEKEFDDFKEATIFAMETGLGFPDVIITEAYNKEKEEEKKKVRL